jgi:L-amino acid N-acyltransferase YncA
MRAVAAPPLVHEWLTSATGCVPTPQARAIAVLDAQGSLKGMALFDGWTENSVQVHVRVDSPMAWRRLRPAILEYAFDEARRGVLLGMIRSDNHRSLRTAEHFGFRESYRVKDGAALGVDLVLVELRREWCNRKAA